MDGNTLPRLEFRGLAKSNKNRTSQAVYSQQTNGFQGAENILSAPVVKKIDFEAGAREFKKKRLVGSLVKGLTEATIIVAVFVCLITIVGVAANNYYKGKSLPFTYVGDLSVGGKTQAEIKSILDEHYSNMYITFSEGGLKRQLKLGQLDIYPDTKVVSEKAVPKKLNPLSFFNWQRLEVPIKMNDRYVAGFIERRINSGQTKSQDAQLVLDKVKLAIQPEISGFTSDERFIIEQLRLALANAKTPSIDVTSVTTNPSVKTADLTDDMNKINNLLQTPINIKYGYSYLKPTVKQKIGWLNISQTAGAKNVSYEFSKGLIRAYILDQVNRYKPEPKTLPDGTVQQTSNVVVENIDEVADSVALALKNGNTLTQQLVIRGVKDNFTAVTPDAATTSAVASR